MAGNDDIGLGEKSLQIQPALLSRNVQAGWAQALHFQVRKRKKLRDLITKKGEKSPSKTLADFLF